MQTALQQNKPSNFYRDQNRSAVMNRAVFLFCFTSFFSFINLCDAQEKQGQARIDSLLAQLPLANEDTSKVNLLVDLSFTYRAINPEEGISLGKQASELAKELKWSKGIADANMRLSVIIMWLNQTIQKHLNIS